MTYPGDHLLHPVMPLRALLFLLLAAWVLPAAAAERIVAVGGAVTESVYALGQGHRLVAIDSTSQYPAEADALPDVGYMRRLSAEPILALRPDLVLAIEGSGPPAVLEQLRRSGVPVETVPNEPTVSGIGSKLRTVGTILGVAAEAEILAARIEAELGRIAQAMAAIRNRPSVLFLISVGRNTPMAGGADTAAATMIELAGGRNAVAELTGYKPLSAEAAVTARPDTILVMTQTLEIMGGVDAILALPALAATPAGAAGRLVAMDGMLLLGLGPRTPQAVRELATALHPDLDLGG